MRTAYYRSGGLYDCLKTLERFAKDRSLPHPKAEVFVRHSTKEVIRHMRTLLRQIIRTAKTVVPTGSLADSPTEIVELGAVLQAKVKRLFKGSLAIRQVDAGSDNACEQELAALSNAYYDIERFGIRFVASPRHADMLMVTGPVTRNMAEALRRAYAATPDPKIVVAVGDDAINGGIFKGSYAVYDGVDQIIPVHYGIPGDPPTPEDILKALLQILDSEKVKTYKVKV